MPAALLAPCAAGSVRIDEARYRAVPAVPAPPLNPGCSALHPDTETNHPSPTLPDSTCSYEFYDPATLKPTNESTYVRLIETGWSKDTFNGKSVLDIGANSGALSIFAHQLGAASVHAFEVQKPFVEFFSEVVRLHNLPITVELGGFNALTPEKHGADVVLCMEVLHWIVQQGGLLPDAVARLAALTGETLFVETPWDTNEPSIANRSDFPVENYDIETILRELARHFEDVRIERFMTYFGAMRNSKRVLIRAAGKRLSTLPLRHIRDTNPTGISMSRGVNASTLLTTTGGPKVLKTLPQTSIFVRIGEDEMNALGDFLNSAEVISPLAAPERLGGSYRRHEADGKTYMLFPFVGNIGDYFPERKTPERVASPMNLAVMLFLHLSQAPQSLVEMIRPLCRPPRPIDYRDLPGEFVRIVEAEGLGGFLDQTVEALTGYDRALEDGLLHGDMQMGNMVRSPDGWDRIVDLDLIRTGPVYADIFSCALHIGVTAEALQEALKEARELAPRSPSKFDLDFAAGVGLLWFWTYQNLQAEVPERVATRFFSTLKMLRGVRDGLD